MTDVLSRPADAATSDTRGASVVWYDGACPVCRREIGWYARLDGAEAVRWIDVADPSAELPGGYDRAALLARFTVRRRDGAVVSGAPAFIAVWRALGPTRLLGRLTDREPFRALGGVLYRAFLTLRRLWRR